MAVNLSKLYGREFVLRDESELIFYQSEIGDVGCVVWDAALVLCRYIDRLGTEGHNFKNTPVLELGAGTGAVGLVSACHGADVVVTDLPELVPLMNHNVKENLNSIEKRSCPGKVEARPLIWGNTSHLEALKAEKFPHGADLILIADCVYYEEAIDKLVDTIASCASADSTVLCCYEERELGNKEEMQNKFFKMVGEHFEITEIPLSEQDPEFCSPDIHIMKFKRRER